MVLKVEDLNLYYMTMRGEVKAVDGVDIEIDSGEAVGIVGESGCGKTSMSLGITRLLPSNVSEFSGSVRLEGRELMKLNKEQFRRDVNWKKISMVFQGAMNSLNPVIKVGQQVSEPLIIHQGMTKEEAKKRVIETFEEVGLSAETFDSYAHELSGGMKQRVVIAMALILNPPLIILDEPTSALDVSIQAQTMNLLKRLKKEMHMAMIFITHDIALSSDISDKMAVMYGGRIVEFGTAEQVIQEPKHPYTQKLLASTPLLRSYNEPDYIPGAPPDLVNPPKGCNFHPRCHMVMDICREKDPPTTYPEEGQRVECWLYGDLDE
ncbi:MAG: ABC transporter ATP-binding protein [Candidatus Bathyarchaeota archaeon]